MVVGRVTKNIGTLGRLKSLPGRILNRVGYHSIASVDMLPPQLDYCQPINNILTDIKFHIDKNEKIFGKLGDRSLNYAFLGVAGTMFTSFYPLISSTIHQSFSWASFVPIGTSFIATFSFLGIHTLFNKVREPLRDAKDTLKYITKKEENFQNHDMGETDNYGRGCACMEGSPSQHSGDYVLGENFFRLEPAYFPLLPGEVNDMEIFNPATGLLRYTDINYTFLGGDRLKWLLANICADPQEIKRRQEAVDHLAFDQVKRNKINVAILREILNHRGASFRALNSLLGYIEDIDEKNKHTMNWEEAYFLEGHAEIFARNFNGICNFYDLLGELDLPPLEEAIKALRLDNYPGIQEIISLTRRRKPNLLVFKYLLYERRDEIKKLLSAFAEIEATLSIAKANARDIEVLTKPKVRSDGRSLKIKKGHLPFLLFGGKKSIPIDFEIDPEKLVTILNSPNGLGKSTTLRIIAQLLILSSIGSRVPAKKFVHSILRPTSIINTPDDLALGLSHFINKIKRLAEATGIVKADYERVLVLFDEIEGTNRTDLLALQIAVVEWLAEEGILSLYASHEILLQILEGRVPGVRTMHIEEGHKLTDGPMPAEARNAPDIVMKSKIPGGLKEKVQKWVVVLRNTEGPIMEIISEAVKK